MSSFSRYDDRRYSSHRDSSRRGRDRDSSRRFNPGPSRGRSPLPPVVPRAEHELPLEFGRPAQPLTKEDENTVLNRMKTAFKLSPLSMLNECVENKQKIKVWTRNFKEVRGICSGFVIAFDKHWNLILANVEEVYMKPKKAKTPFLYSMRFGDSLPELKPKQPRVKKTPEEVARREAARKALEEVAVKEEVEEEAGKEGVEEKEAREEGEVEEEVTVKEEVEEAAGETAEESPAKKKKKKKGRKIHKRVHKKLFIRGDNVVLCALFDGPDEQSSN